MAGLAKDLSAHKGHSALFVGERQPAAVHALGHAINAALGNIGSTVTVSFADAPVARVAMSEQLEALVKGLGAETTTLVTFEGNPLYTAPGVFKFAEAASKVTFIHAGVLPEESGIKATWHLPTAHFLEAWGDARAWDGTVSLVQPIILPLHGGRAAISLAAQMVGETETSDKKLVEATWTGKLEGKSWRKALHDGIVGGTSRKAGTAEAKIGEVMAAVASVKAATATKDALEFIAADGHLKDGRLSNVSWLMELPDSMSSCAGQRRVGVSGAGQGVGLKSGVVKNRYDADVVELSVDGRSIKAPTFVLPGLATYTVVMSRGYGRTLGRRGHGHWRRCSRLVGCDGLGRERSETHQTGAIVSLASTQDHFGVPGNPLKELTFVQMSEAPRSPRIARLAWARGRCSARPPRLSTGKTAASSPAKAISRRLGAAGDSEEPAE